MRCEILVYPGAEELDVFGPYEVLASAGVRTALVSLDEPQPLRLAHGAILTPHARPAMSEIVVVPGGGWANHAEIGARSEAAKPETLDFLREAHHRGGVVAGVCTGAMLLARAGLLRGRAAITHHSAIEDLRGEGACIVDERVVDDGDIVTCGGVTAGIDLALWLVERFLGAATAEATAARIEYERRGSVWEKPR
jgi:transcriptional regulator GlxA family with amidase domain